MLWASAIPTTSTFLFYPISYDHSAKSAPLERASRFCLLLGFPRQPYRITVESCRDCFRCFPLARQAGGSCSCACALEECLSATASSMQPFQSLCGRLPEWSYLPEPSSLERLPQPFAASPA